MRIISLMVLLSAPFFAQAIECVGVETYITSSSSADYAFKPFTVVLENDKFYNAKLTDGACSFSITHSDANGDIYSLSILETNTLHSLSSQSTFSDKGYMQMSLVKASQSMVCMMKCTK